MKCHWLVIKLVDICFTKIQGAGAEPGIFQGKQGFLEWGHCDKHFIFNTPKKGTEKKSWIFFFYSHEKN